MFLFGGCHSPSNEPSKSPNKNIEVMQITNDWIKDKDGCLKLRNEKLALSINWRE